MWFSRYTVLLEYNLDRVRGQMRVGDRRCNRPEAWGVRQATHRRKDGQPINKFISISHHFPATCPTISPTPLSLPPAAIASGSPTLRIEKLRVLHFIPGKAPMGDRFAPSPLLPSRTDHISVFSWMSLVTESIVIYR